MSGLAESTVERERKKHSAQRILAQREEALAAQRTVCLTMLAWASRACLRLPAPLGR